MTENEFKVETGLIVMSCVSCGVRYAVPTRLIEKRKTDHETFYCPNGCRLHYTQENEEERLSRELEVAQNCCNIQTAKARENDYRSRYYKGKLNKIQKEVVANEL